MAMGNLEMRLRFRSQVLLFLTGCFLMKLAFAASFDCEKANTAIEKAICSNDEASRLDENLADAYKNAIQSHANEKVVRAQQRAWINIVRDRENRFDLKRVYEKRIAQLNSRMPLLAKLVGDFECKVDVSKESADGLVQRHLDFGFENGKIIKFKWWAILTPQSSDLRPGFHYSTNMQLSDMNIVEAPGYLSLQNASVNGIQENCDVIFSKHHTALHVFTVGCGSAPDTSLMDYIFEQSGESCILRDNESKRPDVVQ